MSLLKSVAPRMSSSDSMYMPAVPSFVLMAIMSFVVFLCIYRGFVGIESVVELTSEVVCLLHSLHSSSRWSMPNF